MHRVLLGPMPRLAEEILREAARGRGDVRIVEWSGDAASIAETIPRTLPDAVILYDSGGDAELAERLMKAHPGMTVLMLHGGGRGSRTYRVEQFGTLSPNEILDVAARSRSAAAGKGDVA